MGISQKVMDFLWKLNPKGLTHFFWRNPLFFPHKILISSGPINRNPKTLYRIKCDVGASKNAGQAFSTPRLSSHCIIYEISAFLLFGSRRKLVFKSWMGERGLSRSLWFLFGMKISRRGVSSYNSA